MAFIKSYPIQVRPRKAHLARGGLLPSQPIPDQALAIDLSQRSGEPLPVVLAEPIVELEKSAHPTTFRSTNPPFARACFCAALIGRNILPGV